MCHANIYKTVLGLFEFFTVLENIRLFQLDPVPQSNCIDLNAFDFKYLKKAKHRSDTLNGINIMQPVKKLKTHEKVLPFEEQASYFSQWRSRDLICIILKLKIDTN